MQVAFFVGLALLAVSAGVLLLARRSYPGDLAAA